MTTADILRLIATAGLPSSHDTRPATLGPLDLAGVLNAVRAGRLEGLLALALDLGDLVAPPPFVAAARAAHLDALASCLELEARLVEVGELLQDVQIPFRVLKGTATAHLDYVDPANRCFADLDLLVPPDLLVEAVETLELAGFERMLPPLRQWWERRFSKGVTLRDRSRFELDIHRSIAAGWFGFRLDLDRLFAEADSFEVGGRRHWALSHRGRLLHACFHCVLGTPSGLRGARDVAQLLLAHPADFESIAAEGAQRGYGVVLAQAVLHAWELLGLDDGGEALGWARAYRPSARELAAYGAARDGGLSREIRTGVHGLDGPIERALYLAGPTLPTVANLRARHRSPAAQLRRVVHAARGG